MTDLGGSPPRPPRRRPLLGAAAAVLAGLLSGCAGPNVAVKRSFDFSKVHRVAVLDFAGQGGEAMADHLLQALLMEGADVIERRRIAQLLQEASLGASGAIERSTVKELGRLLGVDAVFTGTVTNYAPAQSYVVFTGDRRTGETTPVSSPNVISRGPAPGLPQTDVLTSNASVGVTARMVDVETGAVLWSAHLTYEGFDIDSAMVSVGRSFVRSLKPIWLAPSS